MMDDKQLWEMWQKCHPGNLVNEDQTWEFEGQEYRAIETENAKTGLCVDLQAVSNECEQRVAAAVVAPDLWALVNAARKWEQADRVFKTKRRLPDGSAVALQAAETNLRAALARVEGKEQPCPKSD